MSEVKFRFKKPLPNDIPSLIEIAVEDAKKVEQNDQYRLSMGDWHKPVISPASSNAVCEVCLGGSVIAMRDGVKPSQYASPWDFPDGDSDRLYAIDSIRQGDLYDAYSAINQDPPAADVMDRATTTILDAYDHETARAPWSAYLRAAKILRGVKPKAKRKKAARKGKAKRKAGRR